jgi:hypothetical protein
MHRLTRGERIVCKAGLIATFALAVVQYVFAGHL